MKTYKQNHIVAGGVQTEDHVRNRIEMAKQHLREIKKNDPKRFQNMRKADILNRIKGKKKNDILGSVAREE